jgi:hypothetical protein
MNVTVYSGQGASMKQSQRYYYASIAARYPPAHTGCRSGSRPSLRHLPSWLPQLRECCAFTPGQEVGARRSEAESSQEQRAAYHRPMDIESDTQRRIPLFEKRGG